MSMNYIGSKRTLLKFLDEVILKVVDEKKIRKKSKDIIFLDGFSGTGVVGQYFNRKYNFQIVANDCERFSYYLNKSLLNISFDEELEKAIDKLNETKKSYVKKKKDMKIALNFSPKGKECRMFWTETNALRADGMIKKINEMDLDDNKKLFLKTCVMQGLDKVANTASVYGAFLKEFKQSAKKDLSIIPIHFEKIKNAKKNKVYHEDICDEKILKGKYDIVYLDPPYNQRQYSSNYHPLNFIVDYDGKIKKNKEGNESKTGLLEDGNISLYCQKAHAKKEFEKLIKGLSENSKHIFLSYNNEGLVTKKDMIEILCNNGKTTLWKKVYKKFKSQRKQLDETVYEYLYHCEVNVKGKYEEKVIDNDKKVAIKDNKDILIKTRNKMNKQKKQYEKINKKYKILENDSELK